MRLYMCGVPDVDECSDRAIKELCVRLYMWAFLMWTSARMGRSESQMRNCAIPLE